VPRSEAFDLDQRWGEGDAVGSISMGHFPRPSSRQRRRGHCMTQIKKGRRFMA